MANVPAWAIAVIVVLLVIIIAFWVYLAFTYVNRCPCPTVLPAAATVNTPPQALSISGTHATNENGDTNAATTSTSKAYVDGSVCDTSLGLLKDADGQCVCAGDHWDWCVDEADIGGCVNVFTNSAHCGGCNMSCGTWERCEQGECVCMATVCTDPDTMQTVCTDLVDSSTHCGSCNHSCSFNEVCRHGQCVPANVPQ